MLKRLQDFISSLDWIKYDLRTEEQKKYRMPDQWQHNLYLVKQEEVTQLVGWQFTEVDKTSFDQAQHLFSKQKNSTLSFIDCTTVSVMRENDNKNIATFDEDFGKIKGINTVGL